jgi:hypothetical protein
MAHFEGCFAEALYLCRRRLLVSIRQIKIDKMWGFERGGWTGSLRRWVASEVRIHLRHNQAVAAARYPLALRCLRFFMAQRSFTWFVSAYICIVLLLALIEVTSASIAPEVRFEWARSDSQLRDLLKDAASYYISAQVGALGIVSIAIGLVTLIAQRQNARREIQIYYRESLAQEVVASSVALLVVLCLEIFWPVQLSIRALGIGVPSNNFESILTIVHTLRLAVNLSALAHFVSLSLGFVQPNEREAIRRRYTANYIIPNDLTNRLLRARYAAASQAFRQRDEGDRGPIVFFWK